MVLMTTPGGQQVGSAGTSTIEFPDLASCRKAGIAIEAAAGYVSWSAPGEAGAGPRVTASCINKKTGKDAGLADNH